MLLSALSASLLVYGIDQRIKIFENLGLSVMLIAAPIAVAGFINWFTSRDESLYSSYVILNCGQYISPLGRYSLSVYLFGSVLMNLLFAGPLLALELSSVALLITACVYWLACVFIARYAQAQGWQGLPERWLSVRKHS